MKHLLVIGWVWPEPKSSAAGSRMMQLIRLFKAQNYSVSFATTAKRTANAFNLESIGVSTYSIQLNNAGFNEFVKQLTPDVVLFDRFLAEEQFGWRVAEHCPKALRILDTEDLHGLRKARHTAFKQTTVFNNNFLFSEDTTKREIASIYRCDLSLIISEAEIALLTNTFKIDQALLLYLPFLLKPLLKDHICGLPEFNERQDFITIGNFLHAPNYQAVLYLKKQIWPLIKKQLPKANLLVYGAYQSLKVAQLNNPKEGFIIKGFVDNAQKAMQQAKVCLAPLQFGAGLKGKLIDAMQNGTPCMMSAIAAEGMFGTLPPNGMIADQPESFAEQAVNLYTQQEVWQTYQSNGYKIINLRFQQSQFESRLFNTIQHLAVHLNDHRTQNFIGGMLQFHTLQSSKYLSKWIEAKQK